MDRPRAGIAGRRWAWYTAVAFVLLTLIALVLLPLFVQRRVNELRRSIQASEPARTLVNQWQFDLTLEMGALGELLLTGDTSQAARYAHALAQERRIHEQLEPLVDELGPAAVRQYAQARALAAEWHRRINEDELLRLRRQGVTLLAIPRERRLFDDVLRATAALDSTILSVTALTRDRIATAERRGLSITVLLGGLALVSAVAVIALVLRMRRYATELAAQRGTLEVALAESARAAEQRARLLRGITHDVKNPLGAAKGYAELLAMGVQGTLTPEQQALVAGVERSLDNALRIIADLLDLTLADRSDIPLRRERLDVNRFIEQAVQDFRAAARTTGHEITAHAASEALVAWTDPARLRQVLDNLLSNAIKYTPAPGRITVRARNERDESAPSGSWLAIEVSDTGPGIPPDQREAVFDEFTRLQNGSVAQGHGLGLAVARRLARRLGGDLAIAESEVGATFIIRIPQRHD